MSGNALGLAGDEPERKQHELAQAGAIAKEQHEIQAAITVAKRFPRNEESCFQKLMKAASRPSFAEDATYNFPRGKKDDGTPNIVSGPSVNLAREAGRIWGNIKFGLYIIRDDEETRLIRGWAWDMETNTKNEFDDDFKKLIQRKGQGWIVPDERDLRELTNRRGAILVRNAILQVVPKDLIEDALFQCSKTLEKEAGENPDRERKRLMVDFGMLNVSVEQIEAKLSHPFSQSTPKEIAELRGVCKSIQDGHTSWAEYVKGAEKPAEKSAESKANEEALAKGQEALAKQQEQQPAEPTKASGESPTPITCKEACHRLEHAQSAKEIAEVMNTTLACEYTSAERKTVLDHKELAMKRLAGNGKKK